MHHYLLPLAGAMFAGGGVKGGAWCPYVAQIDSDDPTAVVLAMNDFVGRGVMEPPHYTFTPVCACASR